MPSRGQHHFCAPPFSADPTRAVRTRYLPALPVNAEARSQRGIAVGEGANRVTFSIRRPTPSRGGDAHDGAAMPPRSRRALMVRHHGEKDAL
jgi:hypothetical protein